MWGRDMFLAIRDVKIFAHGRSLDLKRFGFITFSMPMPRRNHQTASLLKLNKACADANGTPLSLRRVAP
jgi:hypothetical protein